MPPPPPTLQYNKSASTASKPALPAAAKPRFGVNFDPWHTSSSGHQRPEGGTTPSSGVAWRTDRNEKITRQFRAGPSGDGGGGGSAEVRQEDEVVVVSVADMLARPGLMARVSSSSVNTTKGDDNIDEGKKEKEKQKKKGIFEGLVVYVNGSTYPIVSDHKLKQILSEQGAQMSLHLGRRKVTHVIVGRPTTSGGGGAGGGLAAGKLEREIRRVGGAGVRFVDVEWVLESVRAGKRLPEARFSNMKIAAKGQGSVYGRFSKPMKESVPSTMSSGENTTECLL